MVREGLTEEVLSEQRPERGSTTTKGDNSSSRGTGKHKSVGGNKIVCE